MLRQNKYYLIAILILAAGLRLYGLGGESLWVDEGFTVRRAQGTFVSLMEEMKVDTQSIAYYCLEWAWCHVFGVSEFSLRFLSVIFGIAAIWAVYRLAFRLFNRTAALFSALLLALNPFAIFYSQDARPYALFLAATAFSLVALLQLFEKITAARILAYLLFTVLALYAHPLAPLLLPVHLVILLILRKDESYRAVKSHLWAIVKIGFVSVILFIPQLLLQLNTIVEKAHGGGRAAWIVKPPWVAPLKTFNAYFMHYPLSISAAIIILAGLWIGWRRTADRRGVLVLITLAGGFVVVPWLESLIASPVYVDRYTIPALTAVIIVVGWALSVFGPRLRAAALIVLIAATGYFLGTYYTHTDKDPWRDTAAVVQQEMRAGDVIVLIRSFTESVFDYYFQPAPGVKVIGPGYGQPIPAELDTADRIILVRSYMDRSNPELDSLFARIENNRVLQKKIGITDRMRRNPGAFWITDIRLLIYERPHDRKPENPLSNLDRL